MYGNFSSDGQENSNQEIRFGNPFMLTGIDDMRSHQFDRARDTRTRCENSTANCSQRRRQGECWKTAKGGAKA